MRVLHILCELKPSGAETMLRGSALFWRSHRIESEILSTGRELGEYAAALAAAGYRIHHLPFTRSPLFLAQVYRFFRRHSYDAVHIHSERANFWYAALAWVSSHARLIRTVHSVFPFEGALRVKRLMQRAIARRLFHVTTIAISPTVQACEAKTFHNPSLLIPNWFDSQRFRPIGVERKRAAREKFGLAADDTVIVSVGNCAACKNHNAILRALALDGPRTDLAYLHVGREAGAGDERSLAADLGISARVRFMGSMDDISPALAAADVFVMPSLYEGFGVAAVEAMGAGLPVILSDAPGLKDLRKYADGIQWIHPTADDLMRALNQFRKTPAPDRYAVGAELSRAAHRSFGTEAGAGRYAELYAESIFR